MCAAKFKAIFDIFDNEHGDSHCHPEVKSTLLPDGAIWMQKSALTRRAIPSRPTKPTFIRLHIEDSTMSRLTIGMPEADELKDMTRLLASLWEAAQRLPEGSERQDAFRQIGGFHRQVAALIARAL
jgi:hypothetical protein